MKIARHMHRKSQKQLVSGIGENFIHHVIISIVSLERGPFSDERKKNLKNHEIFQRWWHLLVSEGFFVLGRTEVMPHNLQELKVAGNLPDPLKRKCLRPACLLPMKFREGADLDRLKRKRRDLSRIGADLHVRMRLRSARWDLQYGKLVSIKYD